MALTKVTEKIISDNLSISGIATASNFKTGTTNVHNVGVEAAGINVLGGDTPIGTGATIWKDGGALFSGIITATSFSGSGANLTGVASTEYIHSSTNAVLSGIVTTGPLNSSTGNFSSNVTISGNLGVAGTITYEDVARVDATGISTFREGFGVGPLAGIALTAYKDGSIRTSGIITASSFGSDINSIFTTGGTERVRIDSQGRVMIGTTTEGQGDADNLTVRDSGNCGITIRCSDVGWGSINFSDATSGAGEYDGQIGYSQQHQYLKFGTVSTERLRIDSSGRLLLGTTSNTSPIGWGNNLQVAGTSAVAGVSIRRDSNDTGGALLVFGKSRGSLNGSTVVQSGDQIGGMYFAGGDGTDVNSIAAQLSVEVDGTPGSNDMPGRILFKTTADGASSPTERLRIGSAGQIGLSGANYGSSGQVLTSAGSGSAVSWTTISGGVGSDAQNNTKGGENAGNALDGDTLGNTLFGENAGLAIDSGDYNQFFGYEAGKSITSGNYNIAMGFESLKTATSGGGNIAIGHKAMNGGNITGANNIAIGYEAGKSFPGNINGNVAIGYRALYQQNGDRYNTAIGYEAGMNIQGAHDIVAVGHKALKNLTSGAYNTAIGWQALESLQTGTRNTAVGRGCLDNCVSGSNNTCMGIDAGMSTTAGENVMIGTNAGRTNTTGDANVYIGTYVADSGTDGSRNVAIGMYAMSSGVGSYNTLIGWGTGHQINGSGGRNNTCLGYGAGYGITDGHTNICIGNEAGYSQIASDDYKLFIARGNVGPGSGSCWVYGDGAGNVIRAGNGTSWSQTSDRRIKKNILDNNVGLDIITKIRIRNFEYRTEDEIDRSEFGGAADDQRYTAEEAEKHDGMSEGDYYRNYGIDKSGVQLGVIAQELEEVLPNMVNTDSKTSKKTTNTDELIWHLVNAVKELSTKNDALEARLASLESS